MDLVTLPQDYPETIQITANNLVRSTACDEHRNTKLLLRPVRCRSSGGCIWGIQKRRGIGSEWDWWLWNDGLQLCPEESGKIYLYIGRAYYRTILLTIDHKDATIFRDLYDLPIIWLFFQFTDMSSLCQNTRSSSYSPFMYVIMFADRWMSGCRAEACFEFAMILVAYLRIIWRWEALSTLLRSCLRATTEAVASMPYAITDKLRPRTGALCEWSTNGELDWGVPLISS